MRQYNLANMKSKSPLKIEKIVVNSGIGKLSSQPNFDKILPEVINDIALITGQKPAIRPAKVSIAGFKIRTGMVVGLKATLRRKKMIDFLNKLIKVVFPRIRDFRGIDLTNVDGRGNLTIGIKEHIVFPEINPEQTKVNIGLQVTVVPKQIKSREEAIQFYKELGMPFKKTKH